MGWSVPINALVEVYEGDMDKAVRDLSLQALRSVVLKTPVDTGRLRGGWLVSIGQPSGEVSIDTFGEAGAQKPSAASGPAAAAAITRGSLKVASIKAGTAVIIENNVEYGVFVNDGSPTIRPHRMLERTVEELGGR